MLTLRSGQAFPWNQHPASGFLYKSGAPPSCKRGLRFHVSGGITVNKTTQTVESAGRTFHIAHVFPLTGGGRDPSGYIDSVLRSSALLRRLA